MRMRKKPNLDLRLDLVSEYLIKEPEELCGRWLEKFSGFSGLYVELGCGKGRFTSEMAKLHPEILFIGIERIPDALLLALERAKSEELRNALFIANDVKRIPYIFAGVEVSRIYINFCDPWPEGRRAKRRLTSDDFLSIYKSVLQKDGEIHFKTDNVPLFNYSLNRFAACGFDVLDMTRDLHGVITALEVPNSGEKAVMTNYEEKFHASGVPINRCVAVMRETAAENCQ